MLIFYKFMNESYYNDPDSYLKTALTYSITWYADQEQFKTRRHAELKMVWTK